MIVAMRAGYSSAGDVTVLKPVGMRAGYSGHDAHHRGRAQKRGKRANRRSRSRYRGVCASLAGSSARRKKGKPLWG